MKNRTFIVKHSYSEINGSKFICNTPLHAAKKAAKKIFDTTNKNKFTISLLEITKNSKKNIYTYKAYKKVIKKNNI